MPDIPASSLAAAEAAIIEAADDHSHDECTRGAYRVTGNSREFARVALEAAAPLLAETVAQRITAHMESHGPHKPAGALEPVTAIGRDYRAWRRHFGIAARVAAGAFYTREDEMRLAAEAIERGDYVACNPEVPRDR